MSRCTAPVRGHRSAAVAAECPACGGRSRYGGYGYSSPAIYNTYNSYSAMANLSGGTGSSGGGGMARARWSKPKSTVLYNPAQIQSLEPVRRTVEVQAILKPDLRDVFLCHAWNDRQGIAENLHDALVASGVKVWFSEVDLKLGEPMMRAIDKGLANSRVGLVLVTPELLKTLPREGVADKELSALLARNQLIPVVHETTYEELRNVSPMLASRAGLDTAEVSISGVAKQIADLVIV